MMIPDSGFK